MITKKQIWSIPIGLSLLMGMGAVVTASEMPERQPSQFRRIEQPLFVKMGVTLGGLALIGLELWWFLGKKRKTQQAQLSGETQVINITVDGGYEPDYLIVQSGKPVQLNFFRKDANSCLGEVLLPDFGLDVSLPLNQTRSVEFTPQKPGEYEFTCGMRMFRGALSVRSELTETVKSASTSEPNTSLELNTSAKFSSNLEDRTAQDVKADGVQEITITVEKGYQPDRFTVEVGKPVRLKFLRKAANSCLSRVLIPELGIEADLPLNQIKTIEFTPYKAGEYSFTCGMNMYRGVIEARAASVPTSK